MKFIHTFSKIEFHTFSKKKIKINKRIISYIHKYIFLQKKKNFCMYPNLIRPFYAFIFLHFKKEF